MFAPPGPPGKVGRLEMLPLFAASSKGLEKQSTKQSESTDRTLCKKNALELGRVSVAASASPQPKKCPSRRSFLVGARSVWKEAKSPFKGPIFL